MSSSAWKRLIRFVAENGETYYGEPLAPLSEDIGVLYKLGKELSAYVITGNIFEDAVVTGEVKVVKRLLGPLVSLDVPIVKCVGLNYMKHILEAGRTPPPYPSFFFKPRTSIGDFDEAIPAPKIVQNDQMDYEGEVCVVIGKSGKDIKKEDALSYVLGYTSGNDVSARQWQRDPAFAGRVPQWCFSKGFDKWAPLGPALISSLVITDPGHLSLTTTVNVEVRQSTNTDDLIFSIPEIIAFISQGTTLEAGTVIMSGTPGGVGVVQGKTPRALKHGDEVKVSVEKIGTLYNTVKYE